MNYCRLCGHLRSVGEISVYVQQYQNGPDDTWAANESELWMCEPSCGWLRRFCKDQYLEPHGHHAPYCPSTRDERVEVRIRQEFMTMDLSWRYYGDWEDGEQLPFNARGLERQGGQHG